MSNEFVTVRREVLEQAIDWIVAQPEPQMIGAAMVVVSALRAALEQPGQETAPDEWKGLTDVQWMNIVNKNQAWRGFNVEDAVHEAVKLTEARLKMNNAAPQPAQQPEADKLLRQALEAMEVQGSEWVILEQNAIAAIRKYLGEA